MSSMLKHKTCLKGVNAAIIYNYILLLLSILALIAATVNTKYYNYYKININPTKRQLRSTHARVLKICNLVGKKSCRTNLKGYYNRSNSLRMAAVFLKTEKFK